MTHPQSIPVLDGACLFHNTHTTLIRDFAEAYENTGFAYLINHGIDPALRADVFDANRRFHALPLAEKLKVRLNHLHRGYIPINSSTEVNSKLANVTRPNQSESFMMMREDAQPDPGVYLSGPNQWPDLPGFHTALEAYHSAMLFLGRALTDIALAACGTDAKTLAKFQKPTTWLRLLHYPPRPTSAPDDLYGSAPHTDFGLLTILATDDVGGLQVKAPGGGWIDVPPRKDAYIVNVGDMLHRLSNTHLRSTPHRVINKSGQERYSVPFFYDPPVTYDVAPLRGTGKTRFDPVNFGDFLRAELSAAYDTHETRKRHDDPQGPIGVWGGWAGTRQWGLARRFPP